MEKYAKDRILFALYAKLNNPEIHDNLHRKTVGLDFETFCEAIEQLLSEELVCNASVTRLGMCHRPVEVYTDSIRLTNKGIKYINSRLSK